MLVTTCAGAAYPHTGAGTVQLVVGAMGMYSFAGAGAAQVAARLTGTFSRS